MKINVGNGRVLDLRFRREDVVRVDKEFAWVAVSGCGDKDVVENGEKSVRTTCSLSEVLDVNGKGKENYKQITSASVVCNPKEHNDKRKGFKYALAKVFSVPCTVSAEEREAIWNAFLMTWYPEILASKLAKNGPSHN